MAENYTFGLPIAASTFANRIDQSIWVIHVGMAVIFAFWAVIFIYVLIRYRQSRNPQADPNVDKWTIRSFMPDAAILLFEILLIFVLGMPIWSTVKEDFPKEEEANKVELTAEQFAWGFHYPGPDGEFGRKDPAQISPSNTIGIDWSDKASRDDAVSINELHVPIGRPTIVYMTSKDVIHSFFVPEFRLKQDVVPGMRIPLWFEPNRAGEYELVCSQLCGLGHYRMKGRVVVDEPDEFKTILARLRAERETD